MNPESSNTKNLKHGEDGVYWNEDKEDKIPYCPICKENSGKDIHLFPFPDDSATNWICKVCNKDFPKT